MQCVDKCDILNLIKYFVSNFDERGIYKMDVQLKTASFGGYDKKAVETYIDELNATHEKEVADLKANVLKLSETVKNLNTMREVNFNESTSTIDNLKKVNDELEIEVTQLRDKLESYKVKEDESASRYESISRTLLEARESADALVRQTENECNAKRAQVEAECEQLSNETTAACEKMMAETTATCDNMNNETTAACEKMMNETTAQCEKMHADTVAACDKLNAETKSSCQEMKESTYANCDSLRRKTKDETDALRAETEYNCKTLSEQTTAECEELRNQARAEAYNIRMSVKRECESVSEYMSQLLLSVDNVVTACNETKEVADKAFPDLKN